MRFVIDSNEYIYAFGLLREEKAIFLFDNLFNKAYLYTIRMPRTIFEEVKRNLTAEAFQEFNNFISVITTVDEDIVVPFEIVFRYETIGFKPADAFIAAYTEYVGAEILVSENRHFLIRHSRLPFKVLTAEKCLSFIRRS